MKIILKKAITLLTLAFVLFSIFGNWPVKNNVPVALGAITGVTGNVTHGSTISINGSGFGTKATSTPLKWDEFNGSNGASLESRGWCVETNTPVPVLSTTQTRATPGRTTSAHVGQSGADVPGFFFGDNIGNYLVTTAASQQNCKQTPPADLYVDYWMYFTNATSANNYKFWRWHSANAPGSQNRYWSMPEGNTAPESSELTYFNAIGVSTIANKWTHHRLLLHPSSTQSAFFFEHWVDGRAYMLTNNGNYLAPDPGFSQGPWPTLPSGDRLSTFLFEMQDDTLGSGSRNAHMYLEDVYIDGGYGRVEICNAATYSSSTHCEIQPYTSWNTGTVQVTVNQGTFTNGTNAYLYVTTDARTTSANFPVTIGGAVTPPPPPTPVVGDINSDHIVNAIDYSILNSDWFTTNARSDLNTDGIVNAIDFSILNANWGRTW